MKGLRYQKIIKISKNFGTTVLFYGTLMHIIDVPFTEAASTSIQYNILF